MFLSFLLILKENSRSFVSFTRIDKKQPKTSSKWRRQSDKSSEGGGRGRIEAKQERLFCHLSLATSKEAKQLRHISHLSLAGIKRLNSYDLFATFSLAFFVISWVIYRTLFSETTVVFLCAYPVDKFSNVMVTTISH